MIKAKISPGIAAIHTLPRDLRDAFITDDAIIRRWNSLTPLARNEFICWIITAKRSETRTKRITVALDKLRRGERRPCCWIGCTHRTDKEISPSVRGIISKNSK